MPDPREVGPVTEPVTAAELPKAFQPHDVEARWGDFWQQQGFFHPSPDDDGEPYCISIPPPNVTGALRNWVCQRLPLVIGF